MTTDTSAEALERLARKLYGEWADSQGIHCNRFPAWNELSEKARIKWRTEAAEKRHAREGVTGELIEQACRALCTHNRWDPDESVTYSGTHKFVREKNGSIIRQWQMHISNVRAALEAVWTDGRDAKDAARYRWLRTHFRFANDSMHELWFDTQLEPDDSGIPSDLDMEIDAAMRDTDHD